MAPDALAQVLRPLQALFPPERFPSLLVGLGPGDDAAVYRVSDALALIATVDFFTPIVDDPYTYGAIAAANALSDVYAMGGEPFMTLNICCLSRCLPEEVIMEILRGGAEKVAEAGAALVGGHSVDDKEPKYGLVALGWVHPERIFVKTAARPGDVVVLTKPLGVGIITTALKSEVAAAEHIDAAIASMLRLNRDAARLLSARQVRACTDVTGFALLGHGSELAEKSGVRLRLHADRMPFLPGAREYAEQWLFPAGTSRNRQAYEARIYWDPAVPEEVLQLLYTPETSGGLLAAVPATELDRLLSAGETARVQMWVIGEVLAAAGGPAIEVVP